MTLNRSKKIPTNLAETAIERNALAWLNRQGEGYEDGWRGAAKDLFYGGCSSGMVSHLIYTTDCEAFAKRHISDILEMWQDDTDNIGERPMPANGSDLDLNWLAWYGFETAARNVVSRAEQQDDIHSDDN